jgi:hypothetical protein
MTDMQIYLSALERCRTAIFTARGQYGDTLAQRNPGTLSYEADGDVRNNRTAVAAGTFGDLTDSGALAGSANAVWSTLINEMDQAHRKLRATETGLSNVADNIAAAQRATS